MRYLRRWSPDTLYARLGPAYIERYHRLLYATAIAAVAVAVYVILALVTDRTAVRYLGLFAMGSASTLGAVRLCVGWSREYLAPARNWHPEDAPDAAVGAWRAVTTVVPALLLRCYLACLLLGGLPWTVLVAWEFGFNAYETLLCGLAIVIFSLYPLVVHAAGFELFLGPLKRDIARRLPSAYAIRRPFPSLKQWLLWPLPIVTVVNGLFVAFYSSTVDDLGNRAAVTFLVTVMWTVSAIGLIARLVLRPVEELASVTARIRAGDLSARATLEREDELGMLLLEFNRMNDDLARARERLIATREEERRRLRRDLHDGLGAAIAGVSVQLQAAVHALDRDPSRVGPLITSANQAVQDALDDVRRLVYGLRPPVLDALGLPGALRDHAGTLRGPGAPEFVVEAHGDFGELRAAVEVAALRIAQEAMTNVVRHAEASRCLVELSCNGALTLRVRDDGVGFGLGIAQPGVGLASMRERAGELGGSLVIASAPDGGTEVVAVLPGSGAG